MQHWFKQKYCVDCGKSLGKNAQYNRTKRCQSCAAKKQFKNPKNHQKYIDGRTLKKYYCIDCKIEISRYDVQRCCSCSNIHLHKIGKFDSKGNNNGNYIDGRSYESYPIEFTEELKEKIRERDNYTCQGENCSMTYEEHLIIYGRNLHVHHIDYDKQNCSKNNLITLCQQCNLRANVNRDYWLDFYKNKLKILKGD